MQTRIILAVTFMIMLAQASLSNDAHALGCEVKTTLSTLPNLTPLGALLCDSTGSLWVTAGGLATAASPTLTEGSRGTLSSDLSGNLRVTLGTLFSGEDQANNLLMTSGGAVRSLQIVGTGGIPSTATNATSAIFTLPTGQKTFHGVITCTGTCIQTQIVYGTSLNSAVVATSIAVCTINLNLATTDSDTCTVSTDWLYHFVVTSATSGTTPLASLIAQY